MTMPKPPVAGVIGWPVAHSRSPLIHRFWLKKLGLDGEYSRFPVNPDHLHAAVRALPSLGMRGVNVTVPHKEKVIAALDTVDPAARTLGAVNTVVVGDDGGLSGYNTDVEGIREAVASHALRGCTACVIGAGGAARAAVHVLAEAGADDVAILARRPEQGQALLDAFGLRGKSHGLAESGQAIAGKALVINASPMGMTGQPEMAEEILAALGGAASGALAFDMVYAPLDTGFLNSARAAALATADGLTMLVGQAATAFRLFYGAPPPRADDAELRALLLS